MTRLTHTQGVTRSYTCDTGDVGARSSLVDGGHSRRGFLPETPLARALLNFTDLMFVKSWSITNILLPFVMELVHHEHIITIRDRFRGRVRDGMFLI